MVGNTQLLNPSFTKEHGAQRVLVRQMSDVGRWTSDVERRNDRLGRGKGGLERLSAVSGGGLFATCVRGGGGRLFSTFSVGVA